MESSAPKPRRRDGVAVFLLGAGTAFGAGNVSPVVPELAQDFDLSLTGVGLLSGTSSTSAVSLGLAFAPKIGERIGRRAGAAARLRPRRGRQPDLRAGARRRASSRSGGSSAGVRPRHRARIGPVFARETGGMARVGVFGASFQFGIGAGLVVGSVLADLGVDWRVGFLVSALAGFSALPLLPGRRRTSTSRGGPAASTRLAFRSARVYRLGALFVAMFAVPLLLGAWLVHYLSVNGEHRGLAWPASSRSSCSAHRR